MISSILLTTDTILTIIFSFFIFIIYYLSIKKCFLNNSIRKWRAGVASVLTFPIFLFFIFVVVFFFFFIIVLAFEKSPEYLQDISEEDVKWLTYMSLLGASLLYNLIIFLNAFFGKILLKLENISQFLFLNIMFSSISLTIANNIGNSTFSSIPNLKYVFNLSCTIISFFVAFTFYKFDVLLFSEIVRKKIKISWKLFIIPPYLFTFIYSLYALLRAANADLYDSNEYLMNVLAYFLGIGIIFLFIWAFYIVIKNILATNEAIKAKDEIKTLSVEVMEALAHTIDAKDEYTKGHSVRVAKYSKMLCEKLGLSDEEGESVYYMALLHDIGKIKVPNEIINGTSKMTDEEYKIMKLHPVVGFDILSEIKSRPDLMIGARWHHERYDGKGYPDGKAGEDIPYFARIIAVADSYDAMTSNRSYRKYLPQDVVRSEIEKNSGTQFDPNVAKCMLEIIDADVNYEYHE